MKKISKVLFIITGLFSVSITLSSYQFRHAYQFKMPWKATGLTERQAAAHLLDRFAFGAAPGEVDAVVKMGLENWFEKQLQGDYQDDSVNSRLKNYDALEMNNQQVLTVFPRPAKVLKEAIDEGVIKQDSQVKVDRAAYRNVLQKYMQEKGYRRQSDLYMQVASKKILTAAYSENQLHQVLTDFWFNHFNVSATKNECAPLIPSYERDVIRPNVTGKFKDLLLATAQSPAMLLYLDNFNSAGVNENMQAQQQKMQKRLEKRMAAAMEDDSTGKKAKQLQKLAGKKNNHGLNENYAREIMELHTLGVDGGYTQTDVTEAAKVLTGWTVYPMDGMGAGAVAKKVIKELGEDNLAAKGFVHKGDFFFAMNRHDSKEKKVLGKTFAAGGGYEEGVALINMLAHHSSTAKFISKKLAVRFVSDNPPQTLIDKMTAAFIKSEGDIKQVLIAMVSSPEFWAKDALREKTKSPFELTISTVRSLNAKVEHPFLLYQWITKMGQQLYYYQAPTGFPDRGQYWINTGSLLNRMKFGLAFAAQKIPGVSFNLVALNNNHEPESSLDALKTYCKIMMPERDMSATIKRLEPMLSDPAIDEKVTAAAEKKQANSDVNVIASMNDEDELPAAKNKSEEKLAKQMLRKKNNKETAIPTAAGNNNMLAQVVGIIIGSPEFQRR